MENIMADLRHRNPVLIPTTTEEYLDKALSQQLDRELLYNRDDGTLGIVLTENGEKKRHLFSSPVDEKNIIYDSTGKISLADDIVVRSMTSLLDTEGLAWQSQMLLKHTTDKSRIYILFKEDTSIAEKAVFGGEILETSASGSIRSHYRISAVSPSSISFKGEGSLKLVKASYNGATYYAVQSSAAEDTNIYFTGWCYVPENLSCDPSLLDSAYTVTPVSLDYNNEFTSSGTLYIYNDIKTERARVSSRGVRLEKKNGDVWEFVGTYEADASGNMFITNDEKAMLSTVTSPMPKNSSVYHLDDDLLDESDKNPYNISADSEGSFVSDDTVHLQNKKAYKGKITIPMTDKDFAFFTKGDIETSSGVFDLSSGIISDPVSSLATLFNENKKASWGLTDEQLTSVIAVDEGE